MSGIDLKRIASSGNPASTHDRLWNDINGTLYFRDSNGVQNQVSPPAGGSGMTSFVMSDGSNNQTIEDGNTQLFTGGVAINGTVGATDTLTLNWNLTKLSSAVGTLTDTDYLGIYDLSGVAHQRIALADLPTITSVDTSNDKVPIVDATDNRLKLVAPDNLPAGSGATVVSANKVHKFASNQTTASNTMVDVDATNAAITETLTGSGKCVVTFNFSAFKSTAGASFYRITDGTNSSAEVQVAFISGFIAGLTLTHVFDTSAGSTTYKLQFRSNDANLAGVGSGASVSMSLMEIA